MGCHFPLIYLEWLALICGVVGRYASTIRRKDDCSVIQPYGLPYDILTGRLYVDTKGCSTDSVIAILTDLPFLHTHIRQYVQSAVFPSVQSAGIAVTSGPV